MRISDWSSDVCSSDLQAGIDSFTIYEKADRLGGVWRENTYPGAACDIPSHLYSYSFEQHYPWRSRFAGQPEILAYLHDVAERRGLLPHVRFNKALRSAVFDETHGVWHLEFSDGERTQANILVSAVEIGRASGGGRGWRYG